MLPANSRLRFDVPLRPALGSTFQPTGFPDIGAGLFDVFNDDGTTTPGLLVESVQSMANRLEAAAWDPATQQPVDLIADLPYVRVHRAAAPEEFLTSSRLEAHRLTSAFVRTSTLDGTPMLDVITQRLGLENDKPLNFRAMADALTALDPFVLLHGVFFNQKEWVGQPRFTRAVSAVIEAHDVRRAVSGGRKSDHVRHSLGDQSEGAGGTSEGYGSIPFHRVEWTARDIRAMFSIDLALLRSYGLGPERTELLATLAMWEIRSFLDNGLRLRTACDLDLAGKPTSNTGYDLPETEELAARITELLPHATGPLEQTGPITVLWAGETPKSKAKKAKEKTEGDAAGGDQ